jgi:predicted regulator of Ras-like GTPase activity (Roadblock/LC7/MglB family)
MTIPDHDQPPSGADAVDWAIRGFAHNTRGVRHALLLGADGLLRYWSEGLDLDRGLADRTAAVASGLISLGRQIGGDHDDGAEPEIVQVRTPGLYFLTVSVGEFGRLAVVAERDATVNLAVIGNEMVRLVARLGDRLSPGPRGAADVYGSAAAPLSTSL